MKSDKKILLAFLLNLFFSVIEFIGGAITGSISIISGELRLEETDSKRRCERSRPCKR